jgi:ABC-type dipeptide/oligopeptide/nickel transport systems, permease components
MEGARSGTLLRAIGTRLLGGLASLLFVSLVTFLVGELAPGDAAMARAGEKATPEAVSRIRREMGLDRPWPERYIAFVAGAVRFDFGRSYQGTRQPVGEIVGRALPLTAKVAGLAILLAALVGVTLGSLAAVYQHRFVDRGGPHPEHARRHRAQLRPHPDLAVRLRAPARPPPLDYDPRLPGSEPYYLALPVLVMAARPTAMLARLTRASMIETLHQEFVKLAVAKGVPRFRLYTVHALRNAILPVVTAVGSSFGILLTGSFITETAFSIPGLGREAVTAIQGRDTPVVLAIVLVTGALFILVNLVVDLSAPLLDPRIRDAQA